ncbi:hypothetical protein V5279_28090 [Bradyrhizobium sp. 26S5]|jgi:hypothetical protein|uniref:hypothetical protein n=1 Tax=Bradyrhizobium sp. 26S5 TaxID=3139729 RepID=UPI001CD0A68D
MHGGAPEIVEGPPSLPRSVKRGLATIEGKGAQPQSPALKKLNVSLGHQDIHHMIARGGCFSRLSKP